MKAQKRPFLTLNTICLDHHESCVYTEPITLNLQSDLPYLSEDNKRNYKNKRVAEAGNSPYSNLIL
jgi:hypothetical protein